MQVRNSSNRCEPACVISTAAWGARDEQSVAVWPKREGQVCTSRLTDACMRWLQVDRYLANYECVVGSFCDLIYCCRLSRRAAAVCERYLAMSLALCSRLIQTLMQHNVTG